MWINWKNLGHSDLILFTVQLQYKCIPVSKIMALQKRHSGQFMITLAFWYLCQRSQQERTCIRTYLNGLKYTYLHLPFCLYLKVNTLHVTEALNAAKIYPVCRNRSSKMKAPPQCYFTRVINIMMENDTSNRITIVKRY